MKVKLFDKYVFTQVLGAGAVCILLFMIIWIAPELLLKTIQRTLSGMYTLKMGVQILVFSTPKILANALPVGLLLGSLFTFDKMSKDLELTTFRSIGLSFWRILAPIMVLSVIVSVFAFVVNDKFVPYSEMRLGAIQDDNESSHFVYPEKDLEGKLDRVVIVSEFDNNTIKDVSVLNFAKKNYPGSSLLSSIYMADYAKYSKGSWVLNETKEYVLSADGVFKDIFTKKDVPLFEGETADNVYTLMKYSIKRDRELDNVHMAKYISLLKTANMDDEYRYMLNKYLQRFSHSLVCILFAIMGCLLGFSKPREQRLVGFTIAVATIFLYYITMPFFDLLAEKGILHPIFTAFIQPALILAAVIWFKKQKDL